MNRKIAFRVWDKKDKIWVAGWSIMQLGQLSETENRVYMQYTGLKDKNGKEIFEGDVVKMHQFLFDGTEVEREHTGIVAFDEELAAFNFTYIRGEFYSEHTGYEDGTDSEGSPICLFYGLHEESFEVIGNIYENPELLDIK